MAAPPRTAVLLGAQRFGPTLSTAVADMGIKGRIAVVTAGWQEREDEDQDLSAALDERTVNLNLHRRGEELFREDTVFAAAHRERQGQLRVLQDVYRIRLDHALEAERELRATTVPESLRDEVEESAIDAIRALDAWHLAQCARIRSEFEAKYHPRRRRAVAKHCEEIARMLEDCSAIAIAGGHIAVLVNRLLLFGLDSLVGDRTVFAWSGGAMAVTERVVLFHDDPPQGHAACEVLDAGLGLVPNVVAFPEPERRLRLKQPERVNLLAKRFAPAHCLALPARSSVVLTGGELTRSVGAVVLSPHPRANAS